jgi:hypothetical protein
MRISKLQTLDPKYWNDLVKEDHLGAIGATRPELISKVVEKVYSSTYGGDDFVSFINKFPKRYIDEDVPFQWMLQGPDERNFSLIKATTDAAGITEVSSTTKAGVGYGRFYMWFAEKAFSVTSVIVGENPDDYAVRVVSDPQEYGDGDGMWRHEVELLTGDSTLFVPYTDLNGGTAWSEEYGIVEQELSKRGNGIRGSSNFQMENVLSMIRKNYEVPGSMLSKGRNKPMAFLFQDSQGNTHRRWIDMLGWQFMIQFRRDIARLLLYGKSNRKDDGSFANKGESKNTIRAGYGLYEQLEGANEGYFNTFNIDALTEFALDISVGKVAGDDRTFLLSTGEYGAYEFHKGVEAKAGTISYIQDSSRISAKDGKLSLNGGQFIEYKTVNGLTFKVMIDPTKDNQIRNKKRDKKGRLLSSLVYDLLDFGTTNGNSNIHRVCLKGDEEFYGYRPGLRDPFSAYNNRTPQDRIMASGVDGYEVYGAFVGGMQVNNPLKTFKYSPSELVA